LMTKMGIMAVSRQLALKNSLSNIIEFFAGDEGLIIWDF